jgi:hypothetical protein
MKFFLPILFLVTSAWATEVRRWEGHDDVLQKDLSLIEAKANWNQGSLSFHFNRSDENTVTVRCEDHRFIFEVNAAPEEKMSTLYHGLFKIGFLFPHPRWQISPSYERAQSACGQTYAWRPAFPHRGFHLHTLHSNEWVKGFLGGDNSIAFDYIRWLARNRQNVLDLSLLRPQWNDSVRSLKAPMQLAKSFGITRGVSLGLTFQQQNSFRLIPLFQAITGIGDLKHLNKNIEKLNTAIDYDFMTLEIGTSEFTSTNYEKTLQWINITAAKISEEGKKLFTKIHVSTNQVSPKWGNFNFLPRYASKDVGLLPHTVMFYGLYDDSAPMYGNKNFSHMLKFIQEENAEREIWYYPETSYWIFMDQDAPLLLTDYLTTRSRDMQGLHAEKIEGHFNFSSGQELGYWLMDWTVALNADLDQNFNPTSGLSLLGEDLDVWQKIIDFQKTFFKDKQLISIINFPNLQDELSKNRILERNILKEVFRSDLVREDEIQRLQTAITHLPDVSGVKNEELRLLLEITELRLEHALAVRSSMRHYWKSEERYLALQDAKSYRLEAQTRINILMKKYNRYPSAQLFDWHKNITSYNYGSLWTAATLFHWKREEDKIIRNNFNPFFENIVNPIDIIF